MLPSLFAAKNVNAKSAYIGIAKNFCTGNAYISNIYTIDTCAKIGFFVLVACIKNIGPNSIDAKDAGRESAYGKSVYAVKHSRIHLQSFSISEIELFNIG